MAGAPVYRTFVPQYTCVFPLFVPCRRTWGVARDKPRKEIVIVVCPAKPPFALRWPV